MNSVYEVLSQQARGIIARKGILSSTDSGIDNGYKVHLLEYIWYPIKTICKHFLIGSLTIVLLERDSFLQCFISNDKRNTLLKYWHTKIYVSNSLLLKATADALQEKMAHYESQSNPFLSLSDRFQSTKTLKSSWPSGQSFRRRLRICSGKLPHVPFPPPLTEVHLLPILPHQCTPLCDVEQKPCEKVSVR